MENLKVKCFMMLDPLFVANDATILNTAKLRIENSCGFLPVGTAEFVEGVITDRSLIVKAIAKGAKSASEVTLSYITKFIYACNENDPLEDATEIMRQRNINHLLVRNKHGNVGVLSFGPILREHVFFGDKTYAVKDAHQMSM